MTDTRTKVLALSSGGGHWVQLLRLRPALAGCDVTFATVAEGYRSEITEGRFEVIGDCNRSGRLKALLCAARIVMLLVRIRPSIVITTGAAPGYFAIRLGALFGAKTIWVDSVANAEELSMSGRLAGRHVDLWLTQWPHLAKESGPAFFGSVL